MLTRLNDFTFVKNQNQIGTHNTLNAVCDNEGSAVFHQALQSLTNLHFSFHIDGRRRIIHYEDAWVEQ